ncbi:MAG: hypothetical protein ACHQVS_01495 [Candidatus Babeliales bacterium]
MNNRYILIVIVALVPAAMKGMASKQPWDAPFNIADRNEFPAATEEEYKAVCEAREKLMAHHNNNNHFLSTNVKKTLDNLINPHQNEPSFLSRFGNQIGLGVALTFAGLITTMLVRKYLTPKSELDREATQATMTEQTILKNLEADIQRLMQDLPQVQKNLETEKNLEKAEYLKMIIGQGQELLQRKMTMHAALSQKFNEDQTRRYAEQLQRTTAKPAPAA